MRKAKVLVALIIVSTLFSTNSHAIAFNDIASLVSLTFWESSSDGPPAEYTFPVNSSELLTRRAGTLNVGNYDFMGVPTREFYDVFFSNSDGAFNADGEYLSIEGLWPLVSPYGGGLNIAEMGLRFLDGHVEYGNYVASFSALGDNAIISSVVNAIDGNLDTVTTLGNTFGQTERLRLTLGFLSSSGPVPGTPPASAPVPEPATMVLFGTGLIGLAGLRKKFNKSLD